MKQNKRKKGNLKTNNPFQSSYLLLQIYEVEIQKKV